MDAVLIGAGGHARVVLDAARAAGVVDIVAVVDADPTLRGKTFEGLLIVGDEAELPGLRARGVRIALLGVGSVDVGSVRKALFDRVVAAGFDVLTVVHPRAAVSSTASLGAGSVVFAMAVVNPRAAVGVNVIINTGAIVEHDAVLGDHAHISPGARLAGGVSIGEGAHVGIGATILQGVRVGAGALIGAGSVVLRDVGAGERVAGVPARAMSDGPKS